ncbi:MAG: DUF3368 domain-containing protein [Chitinophagales bacterium]|nr:DUF3368 domain-containing protein [Chitinophagales bacterium]
MIAVVSDTSRIANLIVIGELSLLQRIYEKIIIPPKVHAEVIALEKFNVDLSVFLKAKWIEVLTPDKEHLALVRKYLFDEGETEAIALGLQIHADVLLIDELDGRRAANQLGLETTGLLGVIAKAKKQRIILSAKILFDKLIIEAGFRVGKDLYDRVLSDLDEIS